MIDNCLLYFLYSIIILSILIIIILSSNLEDNSNTQIISIISTLGLGGLLTLSSKYFSNDYCKDKNPNNSKLGGVIDEKNTQLIEQKKSELQKEQDNILIKNQEIFKILKDSQASPTLNKQVDINNLYSSNDQIIERIYNELFYTNIKSYPIPSNIFPCYKSLLTTYISTIKKEVVNKMNSSKIKETILNGQPRSTAFTNKKYFLEPNGRNDPIILNPNIFNKTNNDKNNTANLDDFIKYLNTTINMKDLSYLTEHKTNLSKAYSNIEKFIYNDTPIEQVQAQPKEQVQAQPKEQVQAQAKSQTQVQPQAQAKPPAQAQAPAKLPAKPPAKQQAKPQAQAKPQGQTRLQSQAKPQGQARAPANPRGSGENNIPDKLFSTNYITKNDENYYIIYNSQLDRAIKYVNQPTDCDLFLKDKTINSSDDFRNELNLIHEQNKSYYQSLQNIFVLFIFNNNRYLQINDNIKNYGQCFEIIGKELQQFKIQIAELIRQNAYYNEQIEMYKAQTEFHQEDLTKNKREYDEKIAQLNSEHGEKIAQLNSEHGEKIAQLTKEQGDQIAQLKKEHGGQIAQLTEAHETQKKQLIKDYELQLSKLTAQNILLEREKIQSQESLESKNSQIQKLRDQITSLVAEHKQNMGTLTADNTKQIEDLKSSHTAEILQLKKSHKKEYTNTFDERDAKDKEYKVIYDERISKLKTEQETQLAKQQKRFDLMLKKWETSNASLVSENFRLQKIEQEYNKYNPLFKKVITSFKDQIEYYLDSTLTNHLDLENIKNDYKKEILNLKNYLSKNDNNENMKNQLTELKKIKEYYSEKEDFIMSFGIDEEKDQELLISIGNLKNNTDTNIQYDINRLLETHFKVIYFQITLYTNFSLLHNLLLTTNKFQEILTDTEIKITRIDSFKYLDFNSDNNNIISYKNLMSYYKNLFPNYDKIFGTDPIINITLLNKQPEFKSLLSLFKYYIDFYSKTTLLNKDSVQNINNTIKNIEDTYFKETKRLLEREKTLEKEYISNQTEFKTLYIGIANYINNKILKDANIRKLYINTLVSRKNNNDLIQTFINSIKVNDNPPQYIIDDGTPLNLVLELLQFVLTLNSEIIDKLYKKNNELSNENNELFEKIQILELSVSNCDALKQKNTELDKENTELDKENKQLKSAIELLNGQVENAQKFKNSLNSVRNKIKALNSLKPPADNANQFNQTDEGDQSSIPDNLDTEINQLQEQIDQLKQQLQQLQGQNNELRTKNTGQLQTMDIVTAQLSDAQQQINDLTSLLQGIVIKLKKTLNINADLTDSRNKEEDIFKFIEIMSEQLTKAQKEITDLTSKLKLSVDKIKDLTGDIKQVKQLLFDEFKTIVKLDNDFEKIPTMVFINTIYQLINEEIKKLKQDATNANASNLEKIRTLEADLKQKEELQKQELQKYTTQIASLEAQIKQLISNQDQVIQQKLEPIIKDYEAKKQEYEQELSKLKQNQWTITTALEDRDKAVVKLQKLEAELEEKKTTLQSSLSIIETNNQIIQEYATEVKKLKDYLKIDTTILLKDLVKNIIDKLTKYEGQEQKLSELSINNSSLQDQLKAAQQEFSTQVAALQKEKDKYLQELTGLKELRKSISVKDKRIKELEDLQMSLLTGKGTLESQLLEKDKEITRLTEIKKNQSLKIQELSSKLQNNSTMSDSEKLRLKDEIQRLNTINQTIESKNQDLSSQILELTKQLEQKTKDLLRQAGDANIENETNIKKLQDIIKTKSAIIIQLTFKNGKLNKLIDQLQKENIKIKEELESNKKLLDSSKATNQELIKDNQALKQEFELNKVQLQIVGETIEAQKTRMQELIKKNTTTNSELEELKKQIQDLTSANLQLTEINTKQESKLESQKIGCLKQLDKIKKELDAKILELEESKKQNKTNANVQEFKNANSLLKEIQELKNKQLELQKEIDELKRKKSEELLQQEIKLKQQNTTIQKELEKRTSELEESKKQNRTNANIQEFDKTDSLLKEIKKLETKQTALEKEIDELKRKKSEELAQQEIQLKQQITTIQKELEKRTSELEESKKQNRTNANIQEFKNANSLLKEIKELETKQLALQKEIEELQKKKSEELFELNIRHQKEIIKIQQELDKRTLELDDFKKQNQTNANTQEFKNADSLLKEIKELKIIQRALEEKIITVSKKKSEELLQLDIRHQKQIATIQKELDKKTSELDELKKQNRTNANTNEFKNANSLLKEIKELKDKQTGLEKEIDELKRKKSEELLQQEIKLKQEINRITKDNEFLQNSKLSNEELNTRYLLTIEKLTQQLTDLQTENARLKTSKDEIMAKELECVKKLKQTKTDLDNKILEYEALKKETKIDGNLSYFNKITKLLDEIKELKMKQVALEKEIEDEKKKKSKELLQLEITLKKEITKLITDNEFLKNQNLLNDKSNAKYLTTISDLTKQLAEIQKENGTLQATITVLMSTKEDLIKDKDKLTTINKDLTIQIQQLNSDITKWKLQLDNQQLQSDSKLRNYKDYILQMQKKHRSQLEILNKAKNEIDQKLLNTERQLTECNLFKENIQLKLEEILQTHQNDKSKDISEIERLNKLLNLLRNENERLTMIIEENLQNYNSTYQKLNNKISELTQNIENLDNDNQTLRDGIELQIDELQEKYKKDLDIELAKLKTEYQTEREKLNKFITNLEQFMTRTNNSNNFKSIESQLKELNDKYNNDISNLKLLNTKLEFEKLNLSKKIQQLSNTVNLLSSSKIKDQKIRDTLDKELKDEIQRLKEFISKKEIDIKQLKLKSQSNETNLLNSVGIISQKENEIKKCKLIISQLEKSLQLKDEELKRFISQIEELKLKISTLESQITSLQVQTDLNNQTKQIEIDRLNQEILNLQNDNRTLNEGIELQLQKINKQQVKQLEDCKKQLIECKQKLDKCEVDLTSCQTLLTTCKTDLKDCKDNSGKTISKFQSELDISNAKLSQLEKDKQNLESQLTRLKEILSKSNDSTATELLKLKESNDKLLSENKTLKETKPITKIVPPPSDDIQVIYKYVEKPTNTNSTTKFNKVISNTAFDKFIMNNSLIY
jgi:chromosome segregation ATPase